MVGWLPLFALSGAAGSTQTNTSSNDLFGGVLNAIDTGNQYGFGGTANPSQVDANGYPSATLTAGQTVSFALGFLDSQTGTGTQWVFKWTPTGAAVFFLNGGLSNVTATGCTVSGSGTTTITMTAGTPCRVTFNWTSLPGSNLLAQFQAAAYAAGSPKMVLCRVSDEAAITAGGIFTPELIARYAGLNLRTLRTMPWNTSIQSANSTLSKFAYRANLNTLGYQNPRYFPNLWAGSSSGTNQYTVAKPTDSGSSSWVNGEVVQANITNASTSGTYTVSGAADNGLGSHLVRLTLNSTTGLSTNQQVYISNISGTIEANGVQTVTVIDATHIDLQGVSFVNTYQSSAGGLSTLSLTVTGKTGGTLFIANESGNAIGAAFTSSTLPTGMTTFVYNSLLNVLMYSAGGITPEVPLEAQISLVNALNVNLWLNIPTYADTTFVNAQVAFMRDSGLKSALQLYYEWSNEIWNSGFPQTAYVANMGAALNISGIGFYSLQVRTFMAAAATTWATARSASNLRRVIAWQAFGDPTVVTNRLNSVELNSSGNAKLTAYAGAINYTTAGQRAVDFADVGAYATYFAGAALQNGLGTSYLSTPADAVAVLQTWATALNSNATDPTTLAAIDNDFRQGTSNTKTIASISGSTINVTANGYSNGQIGVFTTTNTLYSGVSLNTPYYVVSASTNSFSVSATYNGTPISLSGGTGTQSFGILGSLDGTPCGQTLLSLASSIYQNVKGNNVFQNPGWEAVAATYDAYRTGASQSKLMLEMYEGGLEARAPNASECATLGITVGGSSITAATALAAGLAAYKNSSYGSAIATAQFKQFMGTDASQPLTFGLMTHSRTPSWFLLVGPSQWAMLPGYIDTTPYQTYNGFAAFH